VNEEIRTEAAQLLFWEYLFRIFGIVTLQCMTYHDLLTPASQFAKLYWRIWGFAGYTTENDLVSPREQPNSGNAAPNIGPPQTKETPIKDDALLAAQSHHI
jgi:hypothetical protein